VPTTHWLHRIPVRIPAKPRPAFRFGRPVRVRQRSLWSSQDFVDIHLLLAGIVFVLLIIHAPILLLDVLEQVALNLVPLRLVPI